MANRHGALRVHSKLALSRHYPSTIPNVFNFSPESHTFLTPRQTLILFFTSHPTPTLFILFFSFFLLQPSLIVSLFLPCISILHYFSHFPLDPKCFVYQLQRRGQRTGKPPEQLTPNPGSGAECDKTSSFAINSRADFVASSP